MKRNILAAMTLVVGLCIFSGVAMAHHGANLFDTSKTTVLKGTITKFEWGNPHNQIYFDVTDDKGVVSHWICSTEPPAVMAEKGWTRKSLAPGDQITAYVFAAKNGAPTGNLQKIQMADGKILDAYAPGPATTTPPAAQ